MTSSLLLLMVLQHVFHLSIYLIHPAYKEEHKTQTTPTSTNQICGLTGVQFLSKTHHGFSWKEPSISLTETAFKSPFLAACNSPSSSWLLDNSSAIILRWDYKNRVLCESNHLDWITSEDLTWLANCQTSHSRELSMVHWWIISSNFHNNWGFLKQYHFVEHGPALLGPSASDVVVCSYSSAPQTCSLNKRSSMKNIFVLRDN